MSCQSWWCGSGAPVELGRVPPRTPVLLACGCAATREEPFDDAVAISFSSVACEDHQLGHPAHLPASTPVLIDVLASILSDSP